MSRSKRPALRTRRAAVTLASSALLWLAAGPAVAAEPNFPISADQRGTARQVAQAGYSRIPVFRESPEDITGMLHVFDVFRRRGESTPAIRPVAFARPEKPAKELLFELLRSRRQLAIVRDDTTVVGLVTLEDLLEELVGDIRDEHDDTTD